MNDMNLGELQLGLTNLLKSDRRAKLQQTNASVTYAPTLDALLVQVDALPPEILKLPKVALLKLADARRDGLGKSSWFLAQSVLVHPDTTPEQRAAVQLVVDRYVPTLAIVNDTYAENARKGAAHQRSLEADRATLDGVATPFGTLGALVADFAAAGVKVGEVLDGRVSEQASASDRAGAGALRSEIIGALGELRTMLAREVRVNPALPATIDADVFGYFDELQRLAAQRERPAAPATPETGATA